MNNLEKYLDRVIEQKPASFDGAPVYSPAEERGSDMPPEAEGEATSNLGAGLLRRWYIIAITFVLMCGAGIPAIWYMVEPVHTATGAIRVAPILPNVLTGESDRGDISYESFMFTQAEMIASTRVIQRVADDFADKDLSFLRGESTRAYGKLTRLLRRLLKRPQSRPDAVTLLRKAVVDGVITVMPPRRGELIYVSMSSTKPDEAEQIVDSFIRNYMAVEVQESAEGQNRTLKSLEEEKRVRAEKLRAHHQRIQALAQEFGTTALTPRQDMMLQRVGARLTELARLEARRINLETQVQVLKEGEEDAISADESLRMQSQYVNSDATVQELTRNVVRMEEDLILAKHTLASGNPAIEQKQELLDTFKKRLEEKREEAAERFRELRAEETASTRAASLRTAQAELEFVKEYEKRLQQTIDEEDFATTEIGRKQLNIQDVQFDQRLDQEVYDQLTRRIDELKMELKRPARIEVAYWADMGPVYDKRMKLCGALVFGALACGVVLALVRNRADNSLWTPEDVTKQIGIRVVGTTSTSQNVKPARFLEQIAGDYQTIRANLGLLDGGGTPRKLAVTSPGMQEGKTTFAVNLATSLARSGKKVLLVDGDIRKPDIAQMLKLPKGAKGLQEVLAGGDIEEYVCSVASSGLDVLVPNARDVADAYERLVSPNAAKQIDKLSQRYDHVVIDTPPVLAFPDALVWGKITGSVILVSFAGQTTVPDLRDAKDRFAQIRVRVLGTVLSNVRSDHSYHRYGYDYYARSAQPVRATRRGAAKLLLSVHGQKDDASAGT